MLIALLAVLGVNLGVIIVFAVSVFGRRRWLTRQPGHFGGSVRVSDGDLDGFSAKWRRGSGRWVRDVFVWSKAPFMFRNELVAMDRVLEERPAHAGEVKRLGDDPVVLAFASDAAKLEVAARAEDRERASGPFGRHTEGVAK